MISLRPLLEKTADTDMVREMLSFGAQRQMDLEIEARTRAAHGERTPDRINSRGGNCERDWEIRAGMVEMHIPKQRKGSYFPSLFEPRRMAEKARRHFHPLGR